MPTVTVSETYDLSTKPNKMSLVAIHTPTKNLIEKTFPGLAVNHRYFRFKYCDVKLACASVLPADPLSVGVSAGKIAPQDMFNPILYKATTSEGLSTLEYRILGLGRGAHGQPSVDGESVTTENENPIGGADNFKAYYGLLSNRDGFKIAHPQSGLSMRHLVPLVHEKLFQFGQNESTAGNSGDYQNMISDNESNTGLQFETMVNQALKGKSRRMPKMNTTFLTGSRTASKFGFSGTDTMDNDQNQMPDIPRAYVGLIVMPPSKLNVLYYRLVVRWYIEFSGVRPVSEILGLSTGGLVTIGNDLYKTDYTFAKKDADDDTETDMVDTRDAEIEKIMEGL